MNILRRMAVFFLISLFSFLLLGTAFNIGVVKIVTDPTSVKKILADSKIYDTAISAVFDQAKKTDVSSNDGITLTDPAIKAAAEKNFTPAFLQSSTESVIDGIYGWLEGKTAGPEFRIDLTSVKASFAADAGLAAQQRVSSLPACPPALSADNLDAFNATCLPRGLSPTAVATQTQAKLNSSNGFIPDPIITAGNVESQNGQNIFSGQLKNAPKTYQQIHKGLFIQGLLCLLFAAGIIFLSKTRRKGIRRTGFALINAGIFIAFLGWVLNYAANHASFSMNDILATQVQKVAVALSQNIKTTCFIIGGVYLGVGIIAVIGSIFYKRHGKTSYPESVDEKVEHKDTSTPKPDEHKQPAEDLAPVPQETPKPKKAKKRMLIQ